MPGSAAAPVLTTEIKQRSADVVVVLCHGRLIFGVQEILYDAVKPLLLTHRRVVLDLSDLKQTDSMGLGALVRLYVASKSAGSSLELMHLSKQIRNLLGLTGLFDVFAIVGEKGVKFM